MSLLNILNWRYAVKKFDSSKTIPEEKITELLKGMNLAPSSYGLQPYEFIVVNNKGIQEKLFEHSYGQEKIKQASHIIVIAAKKKITKEYIDDYINRTAEIRKQSVEELKGFRQAMIDSMEKLSPQEQLLWAQKQSYIVLGILMSLCADMHIDSCPMEGFIPGKYNEILDLDSQDLHATVVITIGERAKDDEYQFAKKVRHSLDAIVDLRY
jgi:nitroreductase/dihydropteridine reductase